MYSLYNVPIESVKRQDDKAIKPLFIGVHVNNFELKRNVLSLLDNKKREQDKT